MSELKSQIESMSGAVATINPQGETARFLLAEVRGKDAAVAFRLTIIRTAIMEVLKGNPRNLKEAVQLAGQLGKGKKARAYAAGFLPLAELAPLGSRGHFVGMIVDGEEETARVGKWLDGANAHLRAEAETIADAYTARFASAHATVMAEKAAPKAKKAPAPVTTAEATAEATAASEGTGEGTNSADSESISSDLLVDSAIATVVTMAEQGLLSADQMATLRAAFILPSDMGAIATMGADHALLRAQAH